MNQMIKYGWLLIICLLLGMNLNAAHGQLVESDTTIQEEEACSRYGPDKEETMDKISLYVDYMDKDQYKDALTHWRYVYENAPGFYMDDWKGRQRDGVLRAGIALYKDLIKNTEDSLKREAYIDTMLQIYDKRIECFGNEAYVTGRKAYALLQYRSKDYDKIFEHLQKAITLGGEETEYFILMPYMKLLAYYYRTEKMSRDTFFLSFDKVNEIIAAHPGEEGYESTDKQMMDYLVSKDILKCEELVPYYKSQYEENPDDPEVWGKALQRLKSCDDCDETFNEMYKKLFEVEPTIELANKIANCASDMNNYNEVVTYLNKARELSEDAEQKARYAYQVAAIYYRQFKNFPKAREYANIAIDKYPNWGDPYILIGDLYASSGSLCGSGTGFESQTVIWPAIDMYEKARAMDPSVSSKANERIQKYSRYMPEVSVLFEKDIEIGSTHMVNCWIQRSTIVRAKPE